MSILEGIRKKLVRASLVLTSSYVAGTVVQSNNDENQLIIELGLTKGSLTTVELKVEFSEDNSVFYQETAKSTSGGTETDVIVEHQIPSTGKYRLAIPIMDRYIKISIKGTGTVTNSLAVINAKLGQV